MPAAPKTKNKNTPKLDRRPPTLVVWIGPQDGSAPTESDEVTWLHPIKIERAIGNSRVTSLICEYDLGERREQIVDTLAPIGINRQVEVRELNNKGESVRLLMWGMLAAQPVVMDEKKHSTQFIIRIDKHLLGGPFIRTPFWDPLTPGIYDVDRPMIFNPEVDEVLIGNCAAGLDIDRDSSSVFWDVFGPNTAAARALHGLTLIDWTIADAAHRLCWLCNADETFVTNPTLPELEAALGDVELTSQHRLKNLKMRRGEWLGRLLDDLLLPFGCSWFINLEIDADGNAVRRLKCFVRNKGRERELFLQRQRVSRSDTPVPLDPTKSSVPKFQFKYDIANLANRVVGHSSRIQREITIELHKIWPESEDAFDRDELKNTTATQNAHPHAGRMFAANESGCHTNLRPEITFTDLGTYFGIPTLPIARKFLPCISRFQDDNSNRLESRGVVVEWLDPSDGEWKLVKWSYSVLEQECGIWFEEIPQELWNALQDDPTTCRIRVTATIEGDVGLEAVAERRDSSPNALDITEPLDLADKFHDRNVHASSIFAADAATSDRTDDFAKMVAYVEKFRDVSDAAELSCSAEVEGIDHPEYELGDLITRVNGVNIELIRDNPALGVTGKYPQIVGLNLDIEAQKTELVLETFDEEQLA